MDPSMMTPEMMEMAQKMMSNMTPEQMANMQKMAKGMGMPGMPAGAPDLTPEQMKEQMEQVKNMDSATMQAQMRQQAEMMSQQQQYKYNAAKMQKEEGNKFVKGGQYKDAIEKYTLARTNLEGNSSKDAVDVRQACTLNLALAHLKLSQWDDAIGAASHAIGVQKDCRKGFYRRGLGHKGKGDLQKAAADLRKALELDESDSAVRASLEEVRASLEDSGEKEDTSVAAEVPEAPAASSPDMMKQMSEMMEKDPDMMKRAAEQMANMSPEQMEAMAASAPTMPGMPKITPEMAKMAAETMKDMKPEDMKRMSEMAASMKGAGGMDGSGMPDMAAMQKQMADPKVREAMSSMMKNIKPEQMTEMAKSMGMDISEEQAKQVSSMMENMDEKTMERLMQLSRYATGAVAKFQQAKAFLATPTGRKLFMALHVAGLALLVRWLYRWLYPAQVLPEEDVVEEFGFDVGEADEAEYIARVE